MPQDAKTLIECEEAQEDRAYDAGHCFALEYGPDADTEDAVGSSKNVAAWWDGYHDGLNVWAAVTVNANEI